jgi:polyferredoxin
LPVGIYPADSLLPASRERRKTMSRKPTAGKKKTTRTIVQIAFFVLIALITVNHGLKESGKASIPIFASASTHAVCPFGGVVTLGTLFSDGTYVSKIHASAVVLMIAAFLTALIFGAAFCGWICPFGSFQELLARMGRRIGGKKFNTLVPKRLDKLLRYLRYAVLVWVLYVTTISGKLIFADYDPYYALFNFWSGDVALSALIILGLVMVLSLFIERPFCKYACPYGALLGIFNLFRFFGIRRKADTCISCGACDRACPMNIEVSTAYIVRGHQCIGCMKCTSEQACPVPATVTMTAGPKEKR